MYSRDMIENIHDAYVKDLSLRLWTASILLSKGVYGLKDQCLSLILNAADGVWLMRFQEGQNKYLLSESSLLGIPSKPFKCLQKPSWHNRDKNRQEHRTALHVFC